MKHNGFLPLDLQFFADGGEGAGAAGQPEAAPKPENQPAPPPPAHTMDPDAMASAFVKALTARTDRAERSVAKSFAEQYGLTEAEVTALLEKARNDKANAIPPDVQKQLDQAQERANGILITAEVKTVGAEMGLIDPETALLLLDRTNVKVGEGDKVEGVKQALEALKAAKPYLFTEAAPAAWAHKQGGNQPAAQSRAAELARKYHETKYGKAKE